MARAFVSDLSAKIAVMLHGRVFPEEAVAALSMLCLRSTGCKCASLTTRQRYIKQAKPGPCYCRRPRGAASPSSRGRRVQTGTALGRLSARVRARVGATPGWQWRGLGRGSSYRSARTRGRTSPGAGPVHCERPCCRAGGRRGRHPRPYLHPLSPKPPRWNQGCGL